MAFFFEEVKFFKGIFFFFGYRYRKGGGRNFFKGFFSLIRMLFLGVDCFRFFFKVCKGGKMELERTVIVGGIREVVDVE